MKIEIPSSLSQHTIRNYLANCDFSLSAGSNEIELCFPGNKVHMEPFALAMLAAFGEEAKKRDIKVVVGEREVVDLRYAKRMHLFEFLDTQYGQSVSEMEEAGRFIPITKVSGNEGLKDFIATLMPLLHLPEESAIAVSYCVSELVRNVLEHSGIAVAYVCAQYYRNSSRASIGVADRGRGILTSLLGNFPTLKTDAEAVTLALKPGITGSRSFENAGAGLFFTKSLAKLSHSYFSIYSGSSCFRLRKGPGNVDQISLFADPMLDAHDIFSALPYWPGTVVAVDLDTVELGKFKNVLASIRQAYDAQREQRPRRKIHFT